MKSTLLLVACLAGSFAVANAAEGISGSLNLGYDNYYSANSVIPSFGVGSAATAIGATVRYEIPQTIDIVSKFKSTRIENNVFGLGGVPLNDQTNFYVGVEGKPWNGAVTLALGYELVDGGLPGFFAEMHKFDKANQPARDQMVRLDAAWDIGQGWQWTGSAAYSIYGTNGWLLNTGVSYTYNVCKKLSIVAGGNISFSQNYIDGAAMGLNKRFNGTDGYALYISAPYKASENVTVAPYISTVWAGANICSINSGVGGKHPFKDFAPMAGINVSWSF